MTACSLGSTVLLGHEAGGLGQECAGADDEGRQLKRKFVSFSHCQELGQLADLASDRLFTLV